MAFRLDILVTPMDSTTVTTAANPSGMAATARDTATMKESTTTPAEKEPARRSCTPKITKQIPKPSQVSTLESWLSFRCRGVCPS